MLLILFLVIVQIAAAAGLDSPTKLARHHVVYKDERGRVFPIGKS